MIMLNLSYVTATNAKNKLLFYIQSISATSVYSYRAAFNEHLQEVMLLFLSILSSELQKLSNKRHQISP